MYASTEQRKRERVYVLADQLYRERYQYLLRIATRNAANREDASEAVQFAFAAFLDKFDLDSGCPPLAWLTTVSKREAWAKGKREHLGRRAGQEAAPGCRDRASRSPTFPPRPLVPRKPSSGPSTCSRPASGCPP
jgi:DNA-directed RNA polymerase specialized sigma24 family protein